MLGLSALVAAVTFFVPEAAGWSSPGWRARRAARVLRRLSRVEEGEALPWQFLRSDSEEGDMCTTANPFIDEHTKAEYRVAWCRAPETALVLAKRHSDEHEIGVALEIATCVARQGLGLLLASPLYEQISAPLERRGFTATKWSPPDRGALELRQPDFVSTIGGDGLLLYANSLFQVAAPPPIVAFSGGSLGFLAPFDASAFDRTLTRLVRAPRWPVSLRMRLRCLIIDAAGVERARHEVLNEAVIDRGSSPYLSAVEFYCNDAPLTTVQADGLIIATPTGSTAYSLAAGGPMVHPSTAAIVFTPICAHSLSFRPIVFPDTAKLRATVEADARNDAWVTFDGRRRVRLKRGESLAIEASPFPLPTILRNGNTADWFDGLLSSFNFNTRARQRPLVNKKKKILPPRPPPPGEEKTSLDEAATSSLEEDTADRLHRDSTPEARRAAALPVGQPDNPPEEGFDDDFAS